MEKRSRVVMSVFVLLFGMSQALAEDFKLPSFLPGDTVSSDFFNDIMRKLEESQKTLTDSFLQGSWECIAYTSLSASNSMTSEWSSNGIAVTQETIVTFQDGKLSASTTNPFSATSTYNITNSPYEINGSLIMFVNKNGDDSNPFTMSYVIAKISESKFNFINVTNGNSSDAHLVCDKQLLPPLSPSDLTATVDKKTISLMWADNSDDETSFSIRRKDSVDGSWSEVGSVGTDTTSYSDTVTSSGRYWYRIFAINENGDSMGSNVIKIEVE